MMNAKKTGVILSLAFLFLLSVSALEVKKTEFVVSTDPYQNLSISVVDSDTKEDLDLFEGRARKFGEYRFIYYGVVDKISLIASIVDNATGKILKKAEFGPYTLGVTIVRLNLSLADAKEVEEPINSTISESNSTEASAISGFSISSLGGLSKMYYFIIGGFLMVILLLIVFRRKSAIKTSAPVEPHPKKILKSEKKTHAKTEVVAKQESQPATKESIGDTEKKISELQKQLEQIRSEEKLYKLQKQLEQEKQSLDQMKGNSSQDNNLK